MDVIYTVFIHRCRYNLYNLTQYASVSLIIIQYCDREICEPVNRLCKTPNCLFNKILRVETFLVLLQNR